MKKKVLFALIALFSVLSAWAVDPAPVAVTVGSGGTAKTVYLKAATQIAGVATIDLGDNAPTVYETAASTKAYGTKQEVFKAAYYAADGGLKLTPVTGAPTELGNYYIKVTLSPKPLYVPFRVVKDLEVTEVNDAESFGAATAENKSYWIYYQKNGFCDVWYQTGATLADGQILYPGDKINDDGSVDRTEEFNYKTTENGVALAKAWYNGIKNNPRVSHDWNATKVSNPDNVAFAINDGAYDPENDTRRFTVAFIYGENSGEINYAYRNWDVDMTPIAEWNGYVGGTVGQNFDEFDGEKFSAVYYARETAYTGYFDYDWTISPVSANYDGNPQAPEVFVWGYDGSGEMQNLTKEGDRIAFKSFKVEYFTDASCADQYKVDEMKAAGTYWVKASVYTGTEEVPSQTAGADPTQKPQYMAVGSPKKFVIAATQLTLTLMKLEKNYGDPDPVFEDFGVAGWLYSNPNGQYVPFYTLTTLGGEAVSTDKVRLIGMEFQRVDEGEEVYTSEGKAQYVYTIPLSKIHAVTPKGDPAIAATETTPAKWSEAQWNAIDLDDPRTYDENFTVVNGSLERLQIVPRDLSKLKLTVDNVLYNRAKFTEINNMDVEGATKATDKVNVAGLYFTANDEAQTKIPVDFSQVTVTVTKKNGVEAENTNVTRAEGALEGEPIQAASLTLTAPAKSNFEGTKEIKFTIMPRPIDEQLPVFATNEDGSIKINPETGKPVQAEDANSADGKKWKTNDLGAWVFEAYGNNLPIFTGEALVPEELAVSTCAGLKADIKKLALVKEGEGDYQFIAQDPVMFAGDNGVEVQTNIVANVLANGTDRPVQNWDAETGTWKNADKVEGKVPTYPKAQVRIKGVGNFCGERDVKYAIYPKGLDMTNFNVVVSQTEYTGEIPEPTVTVTDITWGNDGDEEEGLETPKDFTTQVNADGSVGENTVSVTGRGNYTNTINPDLNTVGKDIEIAFDADALKKTYGEEDPDLGGLYIITGILAKDKYAMNTNPETMEAKPYLTKKGQATADVNEADESALVKGLKAAITFSREEGEVVGFYPISFTTTLAQQKVDGEAVPYTYVYGNYIVHFSDFADAVEDDPETDADEAEDAKAPVFEIEKRWLTVTALKQTAEFGTIDANTDFTFTADGKKNYSISGWAVGTVNGYDFDAAEGATAEEKEANVINSIIVDATATEDSKKFAHIVILPSSTTFNVGIPVTLTPDVYTHGTMLDNYKFNWKSAALTVTPATLIARAKNITDAVYGDLPAGLDYDYDVTGYQFAEGTSAKDIENKYKAIKTFIGKPFHQIVPEPEEGKTDETHGGKDVGTYVIDIDRDEEGEPVEGGAPTQFENYAITYVPAELTINQKRLDVYALQQTIGYGQDIVTGTAKNNKLQDEDVIFTDVEGGSEASDPEKGTIYEARRDEVDGKVVRMLGIVNDAENYPNDKFSAFTVDVARLDNPKVTAIGEYDPDENENTIGIMVGVAPMENYDIHVHFGKLIIAEEEPEIYLVRPYLNSDELWEDQRGGTIWFQEDQAREADEEHAEAWTETVFVRRGKSAEREEWRKVKQTRALNTDAETWGDEDYDEAIVDNTTAQQIEDYDGLENVKVRFGHYAIMADQWEALVLPFDIDVRKVSPMFGYALFNVVDEDKSTSDNLVFKKENRTIPANTPFLIKATDNTDLNQLVFKHVEIVNPETEADLTVEVAGNKFIGTYTGYWNKAAKADGKARAQFFGGKLYDGKGHDGVSTIYEFPLGAYFEFSSTASAGVRITVVDENGVSTDINVVEVAEEGAAAGAAEGWYTITGIKLEGKPATKGTYIYNGKVVYIK